MRIGIASDHGGFVLKQQIAGLLRDSAHEVVDFGAVQPSPGDDYPDFVIPLARATAAGTVDRGVALCGSGVGAPSAPTKLLVCAWELIETFLKARFSGAVRHRRRVDKVKALEMHEVAL